MVVNNSQIKKNKNPYFVIELESTYIVFGDYQFYKGYVVVLSKSHVPELHFLPDLERQKFMKEVIQVGEAIYDTFKPRKLNYEILGNEEPHLHCHIFPRYVNDLNPTMPVWVINKEIRNANEHKPDKAELNKMRTALKGHIQKLIK